MEDLPALADLRDDLERSDPALARAFGRLSAARSREWWARPLPWCAAAPVLLAAFAVALRFVGLGAFVGLAVLCLFGGLALVAANLPTSEPRARPRTSTHRHVDRTTKRLRVASRRR